MSVPPLKRPERARAVEGEGGMFVLHQAASRQRISVGSDGERDHLEGRRIASIRRYEGIGYIECFDTEESVVALWFLLVDGSQRGEPLCTPSLTADRRFGPDADSHVLTIDLTRAAAVLCSSVSSQRGACIVFSSS